MAGQEKVLKKTILAHINIKTQKPINIKKFIHINIYSYIQAMENKWYTYMVRCADNTLYTGITTDLERRVGEHNGNKKGARYTRSRRPVELVFSEAHTDRSMASSREMAIKKMRTSEKKALL